MTILMTTIKISKTLSGVIFYLNCAVALLMLFLGTVGMFLFFAGAAGLMYAAYKLFAKMETEQEQMAQEFEARVRREEQEDGSR